MATKRKRDQASKARELRVRIENFERQPIIENSTPNEKKRVQIKNVLKYSTISGKLYSGVDFPGGYQTIDILGERFPGQRNPSRRLSFIPLDFTDKRILDIGCNHGGMLFEVCEKAKWCVGLDFDYRLVNTANRIRSVNKKHNVDFFVFDVENEPLDLILDLMPDSDVDVIFLLAVCMWIDNWKELILFCKRIAPVLIFESNGSDEKQLEQEQFLMSTFAQVNCLKDESDDDQLHKGRKLYLARS